MKQVYPIGADNTAQLQDEINRGDVELQGVFHTSATLTVPSERRIDGRYTLISSAPWAFEVKSRNVEIRGGNVWAENGGGLIAAGGALCLRVGGKWNTKQHAFQLLDGNGFWLEPCAHLNALDPSTFPFGIFAGGNWDTIAVGSGVLMEEFHAGLYLGGGSSGSVANVVAAGLTVDRAVVGVWVKPAGTKEVVNLVLDGLNLIGRIPSASYPVLLDGSGTVGRIEGVHVSGVSTRFSQKRVGTLGNVLNVADRIVHC